MKNDKTTKLLPPLTRSKKVSASFENELIQFHNISNSSSKQELYFVLGLDKKGGLTHYYGPNKESAAKLFEDTKSQKDRRLINDEKRKFSMQTSRLEKLISALGDQVVKFGKFMRGY